MHMSAVRIPNSKCMHVPSHDTHNILTHTAVSWHVMLTVMTCIPLVRCTHLITHLISSHSTSSISASIMPFPSVSLDEARISAHHHERYSVQHTHDPASETMYVPRRGPLHSQISLISHISELHDEYEVSQLTWDDMGCDGMGCLSHLYCHQPHLYTGYLTMSHVISPPMQNVTRSHPTHKHTVPPSPHTLSRHVKTRAALMKQQGADIKLNATGEHDAEHTWNHVEQGPYASCEWSRQHACGDAMRCGWTLV